MKIMSKTCEYGIRSVLHIATVQKAEEYVPVRAVAEHLNISYHFLAKIVQTLAQEGILISYRGPNGGVALARSADRITLREIVTAIDGEELFFECLLGLPGCGEQRPCPLHQWWAAVRTELSQVFAGTTVAELRDKVTRFDLRLAP